MHVVANLHVLKVELRTIPGISGDGTISGSTAGVLESRHGVYHDTVQEFVCCSNRLKEL